MKFDKMALETSGELRQRAEAALLGRKNTTPKGPLLPDETMRQLHELQVHQIELEMQNEALQAALAEAEAGHHFTDLFEFAPVAYFTINRDSSIELANKAGYCLLGIDSLSSDPQRLAAHVDAQSIAAFNTFLSDTFGSNGIKTCEIVLRPMQKDKVVDVRIDASPDLPRGLCNLAITDISERKQIEVDLRRSKEDLNRAQAVAHIGSCHLASNPHHLTWSPESSRIFGLAAGSLPSYAFYLSRIHPDDKQCIEQLWKTALKHGQGFETEFRIVVDGRTKWLHEQVSIEHDASGKVSGAFGTVQDITERKLLEDELRRRERYRRAILDNIPCLVWLKDEKSNFLAVNTPFANAFGYTAPEALVGKNDFDIVPADLANAYRADDQWILESGTSKCIEEKIKIGGERRWCETWKSPVTLDGQKIGTVGFSRDITEIRQITERLRESEAFNIAILDSLTAQIVVLDENGLIVATNKAREDFLAGNGFTESLENEKGLHYCKTWCTNLGYACQGPNCDLWKEIELVLQGLRGGLTFEYQDAKDRWFRMSVHPLPMPRRGVVIAHEDISELKRAVEDQAIAKAEADHANQAKSRFLAAASHDLRQPLFALTLYVGMLKNRLSENDTTLLNNMTSCVSSLNELLTDLLDISKLDAGVVKPEIRDFGVNEMVSSLISINQPEATLKGLRIRWVPTQLIGHTDPVLFRRIIGNLISNAVRYTERGGVLVACRRREGKIWLEVRDTGAGIPDEKIDEIFEEFRQLGEGERTRGSGLGLAIVAKATDLLGLKLRVHSKLGKGSKFAVELPLSAESRQEARNQTKPRCLRIALVDDNVGVLDALALALQESGHQVVAATSGTQLIKRLGNEPPDLVISDFRLGQGETGFDVISSTRAIFSEKLPAMLITGDTDPKIMRSMADRGIIVHYKPLEIETLQNCIAGLTERRVL